MGTNTKGPNGSGARGVTLDEIRDRPTITVEEAAAVLGISRPSAYSATRRGEIPSVKVGRRVVVPTAALLRMLDPTSGQQTA